jgi:hypothetical protein
MCNSAYIGKKACMQVVLCSAAEKMSVFTVTSMHALILLGLYVHGVIFADNTIRSQDG